MGAWHEGIRQVEVRLQEVLITLQLPAWGCESASTSKLHHSGQPVSLC